MTFRMLAAMFIVFATANGASGQDLVGSWTLVSSVIERGGQKIEPFGPNPKGALILEASGRYAAMIVRTGLPKLVSDNRSAATPEEAKAIVAGSVGHFGSYTLSDADKTITFHIETSTHPNWDATEQKRTYTLSADMLTYSGGSAVVGGSTVTLVWKRAN